MLSLLCTFLQFYMFHLYGLYSVSFQSVKRGHIHIVRSLLNQGCNFSSPISEHNAVKFAKAYNQPEIMHLLSDHIHR